MSERARVLVVDDERLSRTTTCEQLRAAGHVAEASATAYAALDLLDGGAWDVVLTDLRMPGMDGLSLLGEAKRRDPEVDVIVMTAYGTVETAVAAMQRGAADYLTKPFRFPELEVRLRRLWEQRATRRELSRLKRLIAARAEGGILGESPGIRRAADLARAFAGSAAPVLICGETGTGKELFARALHDLGPRKDRPYVAVPCGAVPRELAEGQLFGHEKGAFTGAVARHRGFFEEATGGTLVLDDVDDLPLDIQVKLLRVLQEGVVRRLGAEADTRVDVRVVAITKVDLQDLVKERRFREDLYYRIRGLEIRLPPLRERGDDVLILAQGFLRTLGEPGPAPGLSAEAARYLRRHLWPGNVRELRRVLESAVAMARDRQIEPADLPDHLTADKTQACPFSLHLDAEPGVDLPALVASFEAEVIAWAMRRTGGQQSHAAQLLGIPRTTLQSKLGRTARE